MSHHVKIRDLRDKSKEDMLRQLSDFKKELSQLRVAQQLQMNSNAGGARLGRIRPIRKSIARILTVLNKNERDNLRKFYSDKKMRSKKPKAIREKLTRRRRLALKDNEKNRKTRHQLRMAQKYPKRVFAVKI